MKIKNHMTKRGRRIQRMMGKTFGIDPEFILKCCQGDRAAIQELGQMGKEGALISKNIPKFKERALNAIKGTEDLNTALAEIIQQGASSSLAIGQAATNVTLANQSYGNQVREIQQAFVAAKDKEALRHKQSISYTLLNAWIEKNMMRIDGQEQIESAINKPALRQMDADAAYEAKITEHLLKHGDSAQVELIPEKNYLSEKITGFISKVKQAIAGF